MIDNWLLGPIGQCVKYLADEIAYAGLVRRGLTTMTGMQPFFDLAQKQLAKVGVDTKALNAMAQEYQQWELTASEHVSDGFSTVHRHSLVGLWCVVETAIEDSVLLILEKSPVAEDLLVKAGYRIKPSPVSLLKPYQLRRLYSALEHQAREGRSVAEAWVHLLSALDVVINLDPASIEALAEANELRNCILHRGGVLDDRAAENAPKLKPLVGQKIEIDEQQYVSYYDALGAFSTAMLGAVVASSYMEWKKTDS